MVPYSFSSLPDIDCPGRIDCCLRVALIEDWATCRTETGLGPVILTMRLPLPYWGPDKVPERRQSSYVNSDEDTIVSSLTLTQEVVLSAWRSNIAYL